MRFRELLSSEFDRCRARNPRYSLRSFARFLRVDHSTLSQIIRGCRRLTPRAINSLGRRLGVAAAVLRESAATENDAVALRAMTRPVVTASDSRNGMTVRQLGLFGSTRAGWAQ